MNALRILFNLIPLIISFIHAAEAAFPGSGTGKQKLSAVTDAVGAVVDAIPAAAVHLDEVKASLKPTVDALVSTLKGLNALPAASPAAPASAAAPAPASSFVVPGSMG